MDKHVLTYIEARLARIENASLNTNQKAKQFCELASIPGVEAFLSYARRNGVVDAAALSDLQKSYRRFFREMLESYNTATPAGLTEREKIRFFTDLKRGWIRGVGPKKAVASRCMSQADLVPIWQSCEPVRAEKLDVEARIALEGELVRTEVDGAAETEQVAGADMVVIRNPTGEEYAVKMDAFRGRYNGPEVRAVWQRYRDVAARYVVPYTGPNTYLMASWGEPQRLETGDYLACVEKSGTNGDLYRIARSVFETCYRVVDEQEDV